MGAFDENIEHKAPLMRVDIMTLFPDTMRAALGESILGRAAAKDIIEINCIQIREFTENKQGQVDDYTYGGGWGCVMMAQPLKSCLDFVLDCAGQRRTRVIYMSPQGTPYNQEKARQLKEDYDHLVLICGHYEGVDERFIEACVDEEISIGDFVLTGGEIPAMALADSVCRLVPGVLSDEECFIGESHWDGLLEYPQYTRPELWEGRSVPEILRSGHHANIAKWRRKQSIIRTKRRRPDLYGKLVFTEKSDLKLLAEIEKEQTQQSCEGKQGAQAQAVFRRAAYSDLDDIMDIIGQAQAFLKERGVDQWQVGCPQRKTFRECIEKGRCYVVEIDGECVAVATVGAFSERVYDEMSEGKWLTSGSPYAVINRTAVCDEYRGKGIGNALISGLENVAASLGCFSIRIDTHEDNAPMRGLLVKRGFVQCGRVFWAGPEQPRFARLAYEKILGENS